VVKPNDDRLGALLKQWGDIEPRANFEANVWRRIRRAEAGRPQRIAVGEWLRRWLPQPVLATTAVVVVSALIGSSAGVLSARGRAGVTSGELQFLGSGTLAGGYVNLATGRAR
jgi:hypothetical protein